MDAFCGFVREVFGANQRSSVFFPSKYGLFQANFSITSSTSWEKVVFGPPLRLSPDRSISESSKTAGLHSRQLRFLIGAKATA